MGKQKKKKKKASSIERFIIQIVAQNSERLLFLLVLGVMGVRSTSRRYVDGYLGPPRTLCMAHFFIVPFIIRKRNTTMATLAASSSCDQQVAHTKEWQPEGE